MAASSPLRIGVIGAGSNTKLRHLPGFQAIDGVQVGVVCNRSETSSRAVAETFGIPRIAATWEDVVQDPEIDAICIGTWPYLHAPITLAALAAGKHVLTEARMAMNADEAATMLDASQAHPDLVTQIVPSPITLPWDRTVTRLLAEGAIGELREIRFHKTMPATADSEAPLSWRLDETLSGHNIMTLGIHYEPILRWTETRPGRVWADGATFTRERRDPGTGEMREVRIPESLTLLAKCDDDVLISGHLNSIESGRGQDGYVLNGTRGTLTLGLRTGELRHCPHGGSETVVAIPDDERGAWRVEADFVASIREGRPVTHTSFPDGLAYMRFTSAVHASFHGSGIWTDV